MPTLVAADVIDDRYCANQILLAHLVDREGKRDKCACDRCGPGASVGLNDVAVERRWSARRASSIFVTARSDRPINR
jgi:hypothetical protein